MTTGSYGDQPPQQPQGGYGPPQQPPGGYGPPQQPQGGYGPPPGSYSPGAYGASTPARAGEQFGVIAGVIAAVAAIVGVLSLTTIDWFTGGRSHFPDVRKVVTSDQTKQYATGLAKVYYGWLAWVLLVLVVIVAFVAAAPNIGRPFRVIGAALAVASIVISFLALKFLNSKAGSIDSQYNGYSSYIKHARAGFWMLVAAFLLAGIAAAIGAQRNTQR